MLFLCFLLTIQHLANCDNIYFYKNIPDEETYLTAHDFAMAEIPDFHLPSDRLNMSAMYNPNLFEGDIIQPPGSFHSLRFLNPQRKFHTIPGVQRNAVKQSFLKWADGRIPYTISSQFTSFGRKKISEALNEYKKKTCINFSPKTAADQDYVHIIPDDGCYSLVGRVGGKQPVSLGAGCLEKGIIIHELMHSVGFFHEQSRADRDEYVTINWSNVEDGLQDQFDKYPLSMIDHLETKYDYQSIMHYTPLAFSKNGKPTIEPKERGVKIGQREGFSVNDLYKINKLYNCSNIEEYEKPLPSKMSKKPKGTNINSSKKEEDGDEDSTSITGECEDSRRDCEFLARAGHCNSKISKVFMKENCPKSCGHCDSDKETSCTDSRSWCSKWAASGMCTQALFKTYMSSKCAKSCQVC